MIKQIKIIHLIFFTTLVFGLDVTKIQSDHQWTTLETGNISITSTHYLGFPICKAETELPYSLSVISKIIEDVGNYPNVFLRVTQSRELENDVVHIMLDMPFPFAGRDYIIKYNKHKFGDEWSFRFSAVQHENAPIQRGYVRLIHAAGEWKLSKINEQNTRVTYTWNGELLGDFPAWGLSRAWIEQGNEMMNWLNDVLKKDYEN